ncbi:MAG: glycosyltransferase [Bacteroidales bacterium]|nr:glycosyltransferase [Bacteroidales bacterium]
MTPQVSVVMAAKNYGQFLAEAIESVLAQTVEEWELLIIDDGSTDHTQSVAAPFLMDRRIRIVSSDRLGQPRAKNLGVRLSSGSLVAFLDADDAWLPTKLERQLAVFADRPEVGVCFTKRTLMNDRGEPIFGNDPPSPPRGRVLEAMFLRNFVCFSSVMVRRQVFDHVGGFDPEWDLSIDYDLWLRVARFHEFEYVDEPLVRYRTGHGNLSKKLADRVATADAIMNRAVFRRDLRNDLPRAVLAEGYASTYRALGYTLRNVEPITAAQWYLRALAWGGPRWRDAAKGLVASGLAWIRGRRESGTPENATANR